MISQSETSGSRAQWARLPTLIFIGAMAWPLIGQTAAPSVAISSATVKNGKLTVQGNGKGVASSLELYDTSGRYLASTQRDAKNKFKFTLELDRVDQLCAVRVKSDEASSPIKAVKGAAKTCAAVPQCQIVAPAHGAGLSANQPTSFEAVAKAVDAKNKTLTYEWDFGGGAAARPTALKADNIRFERNDSTYRVRFVATDSLGRRCEDSIRVEVGQPPVAPTTVAALADAAARSAPKRGSELDGKLNDVVVLPFEEWSMNNDGDMKSIRNGYMAFNPLVTSLNAYAYKKGLKPQSLGADQVELRYSAASNPFDPVGPKSINTTSRNWPLDKTDLSDAAIQKTDIWTTIASRTDIKAGTASYANKDKTAYDNVDTAAYRTSPWIIDKYFSFAIPDPANPGKTKTVPGAAPDMDEGAFRAYLNNGMRTGFRDPNNSDHGRYMPGKANPYTSNDSQPFSGFELPYYNPYTKNADGTEGAFETGKDNWWSARQIPITGIDDQGRDNPFNLLRVEAVAKGSTVAKTDGVLSSGRDLHCRECHSKGGIAAPENPPQTVEACRGSAFGKISDYRRTKFKRAPYTPCEQEPKPKFWSVADIGGDPNSLFDVEYVAAMNANSLHEYYDGFYMATNMLLGTINSTTGKVTGDRPMNCWGCHFSAYQADNFGRKWSDGARNDINDPDFYPDYSVSMHRFHGELQWNDAKTGIERDSKGMYARFDWRKGDKKRTANANLNPRTLFPVFKDGKQLPMEENCLKCHGGKREQHYRDRMFTAGISCYDCHGDMLAMGGAFTKTDGRPGVKDPSSATDTSGEKHDLFRTPWYDEPDCGACHTGKGGEAVRHTAFDPLQPAQMSFKPDLTDPDAARFAVVPKTQKTLTMRATGPYDKVNDAFASFDEPLKIDAAVFRFGKDTHGNVACAACHGAAHAIWPNRDPNANDNVTSLQLQGHAGPILACNVCHDSESFKNEADLDGSTVYSGDPKPGILGGPHNTHPIDDPYWYKTAGDGSNGGWHNNYATKSGKNGEDQCAACHGKDHLGTRLSKTPVDREFKVVVKNKAKTVKIAAGTPIGCDLCHDTATSFKGTPQAMAAGAGSKPAAANAATVGTTPVKGGDNGMDR